MSLPASLRHYLIVTGGYWAFTITDGAIRMLVVLYFHSLGYSAFEVAMLFIFYEFFGIVTNLVGGWLGARIGLNLTMHIGMTMQVVALAMLTVPESWLTVAYVMLAQALSGIAKDLNKMSAKASVKTLAVGDGENSKLFRWVALLTGSKNALKGVGFFIGAALLQGLEFRGALWVLAGLLAVVLLITFILLPSGLGKMKSKPKFSQVFSNKPSINWLAVSRFFLFGSRDVWFVVGLPVFLHEVLGWDYMQVGGFMATWIIGYGIVQASAPRLIQARDSQREPGGRMARYLVLILALIPVAIAVAMQQGWPMATTIMVGLIIYGAIFALNSAVHSFLILAYADNDKVSMNVGFYYMANAGGRLLGTILSGLIYMDYSLIGCLYASSVMLVLAWLTSLRLPETGEVSG